MSEFADKRKDVESVDNKDSAQFQDFLDNSQYKLNGILRYEKIFGRGFISTGGKTTTEKIVGNMNLKKGEKVLSVGCGIGGGEIHMVKTYGVKVHAIDLSHNMLSVGRQRAAENEISDEITFEHANALIRDFEEGEFDVIYSRDCIIHIREKADLFARFFKWLKPGGRLVISDYVCCPDEEKSEEFWKYLADRKYDLRPMNEYADFLKGAGFDVKATNMSDWFIQILDMELARLEEIKEDYLKAHSEKDYRDIREGWEIKLVRCRDGTQQWAVFECTKPSN